MYDALLSSFTNECELLIGNEISLILLHLGDEQVQLLYFLTTINKYLKNSIYFPSPTGYDSEEESRIVAEIHSLLLELRDTRKGFHLLRLHQSKRKVIYIVYTIF